MAIAVPRKRMSRFTVAVLLLLGLMVYSGWRAFRQPRGELIAFALTMLMIFVFALHDFLMISNAAVELWRTQFFWLQFAAPIFMVTMMLMLANQFATRLREVFDVLIPVRVLTCFILILILLWVYICFGLGRSSLPLVALPTLVVTGLLSGISIEVLAIPFAVALALFLSVPEHRGMVTGRQSFPTR